MATVATRREKNLVQRKNKRTYLTPTGLLMEGVSTKGNQSHSEFRKLNKSFRSLGVSRLNLPVTP